MNNLIDIESALKELPEEIGRIGHDMSDKMRIFKTKEAELAREEAKLKLQLAVKYFKEGGNKEDIREKIKNEVIDTTFDKRMEVIKAETDWKNLDVDYWVGDKKHKSLMKSADLWQTEQYQIGKQDKIGKPVFSNNTGEYKKTLGRD